MNKEEIIRMAREAGLHRNDHTSEQRIEAAERFAALVEERTHTNNKARWYQEGVEAEREECAKVLDEMAAQDKHSNYYVVAARAIRARGKS